jgi:hypothetical protein
MKLNQSSLLKGTLDLMKNNFRKWNIYYLLLFFILIPLINILIYALPEALKSDFFIFHTSELLRLQTYILSSYTHVEFYPHMVGNLVFYYIVIFVIFAFENNQDRFHKMAILALIFVPIIISLFTAAFWQIIGKNMNSLGFSGIDAAFFAYAFVIGFAGFLGNSLESLDHSEMFKGHIWVYYLSSILITIAIALIVLAGEILGIFLPSGNSISNGLAHFIGFIVALIAFLIIDIFSEKRKYFDIMIAFSIIIGILGYSNYLRQIM